MVIQFGIQIRPVRECDHSYVSLLMIPGNSNRSMHPPSWFQHRDFTLFVRPTNGLTGSQRLGLAVKEALRSGFERRIDGNGGDVFQRENILFESSQRTPLRTKNGRKSCRRLKDGSDFLRTMAPYQQVTSSDASFLGSCAVGVPPSI